MVAGPETAWERVRALLEIFGRPYYMGARAGAGQTMKLVNNLLSATGMPLMLTDSRDAAIANAWEHQLQTVSVH